MIKLRLPIAILIFLAAVYFLYTWGRPSHGNMIEETELRMGTVVQVKAPAASGEGAVVRGAVRAALDEIRRIEKVFSVYDKTSEISK